jgi:penicillin-binding protein 2
VVLDPRDNGLLAIASRPTFDPNQLVIGLSQAQWDALNGPEAPLQFRAAESVYAAASTFKVITMAAGMERIGVRTSDRFDCGIEWRGLPGVTLHNWTPQGTLDLIESLSQSCNPAFYEIGLRLDQQDPSILPGIARAFGLGGPTGVEGISEVAGRVPDPAWKRQALGEPWTHGDAVNLAIGQGYLSVSPLQLANAYSALANDGTLRTPLLVQAMVPAEGAQRAFTSQEVRRLPLNEATRTALLEGMKRVTGSANGSAAAAFRGAQVPTAAKTGSAENEGPDAHAWFVGYRTPDEPSALVLVMVEGGQMSATTAAPLGREMLDFVYPLTR